MENNRRCENCKVDVHRASMQKHFRSRKHSENRRQNDIIIPEWLFKQQTSIKNKIKKYIILKH